jgi:hypothetical protein
MIIASDRKTLGRTGGGEREGYGGPRDVTSLSLSNSANAIDETQEYKKAPNYSSPSIAWDGWIEGAAGASPAFAESSIRVTSSLQTSLTAAFFASNEPSGAPKIDSAARRTFFWVALPSSWAMACNTAAFSAVVKGTTSFFFGAGFFAPGGLGLPEPPTHSPLS